MNQYIDGDDVKCLAHLEDDEKTYNRGDYDITVYYFGCMYFWRVHFSSEYNGPYNSFRECAEDVVKSGYTRMV